jgi:hypothetical protein
VAFAGWISDDPRWSAFAHRWKAFLKRHGIRSLHMGGFMGRAGIYQGVNFSPDQKLEVLKEAIHLVNCHTLGFFACAVDNPAFEQMSAMAKQKCGGDAHMFCFREVIKIVVRLFKTLDEREDPRVHYDHPIGLIFDDNREYAVKCYRMLDDIKERNPIWKKRIGSICFCDDELYEPLQAADLGAWLANNRLKAQMEPSERHRFSLPDIDALLKLATQDLFWDTQWFTEEDTKKLDEQLQSMS